MTTKKIVFLVLGIVLFIGAAGVGSVVFFGKKVMDEKISEARVLKAESELAMLETALLAYERNAGIKLPTQEQGLKALVEKPIVEPVPERWRKMVADDEALIDPWGNSYQYRYPSTKSAKKYDLWSLGHDGVENENDIGNW